MQEIRSILKLPFKRFNNCEFQNIGWSKCSTDGRNRIYGCHFELILVNSCIKDKINLTHPLPSHRLQSNKEEDNAQFLSHRIEFLQNT